MNTRPETTPRTVSVAAVQLACGWDLEENLATAERLVREAARRGAHIILLPELFQTPYFCQSIDDSYFALATPVAEDPAVALGQALAEELDVVLPISTFERDGNEYFNSVTVVDAGGAILGTYRKTHIPEGPGYPEKFYFSPGDTGLIAWDTKYATIGVGICWDQWFPETARTLALQGAELLLFPTAIGSSPQPDGQPAHTMSQDHQLQDPELRHTQWQTVQRGHAAANMIPVIAANRVGREHQGPTSIEFFGQSFIADQRGAVVQELGPAGEGLIQHTFDLDQARIQRASWGLLRDRRPEAYARISGTAPAKQARTRHLLPRAAASREHLSPAWAKSPPRSNRAQAEGFPLNPMEEAPAGAPTGSGPTQRTASGPGGAVPARRRDGASDRPISGSTAAQKPAYPARQSQRGA